MMSSCAVCVQSLVPAAVSPAGIPCCLASVQCTSSSSSLSLAPSLQSQLRRHATVPRTSLQHYMRPAPRPRLQVGYRSSSYASKLRQQGLEAKNLEGSIVRWVRPCWRERVLAGVVF